jgi:hypothetical protein
MQGILLSLERRHEQPVCRSPALLLIREYKEANVIPFGSSIGIRAMLNLVLCTSNDVLGDVDRDWDGIVSSRQIEPDSEGTSDNVALPVLVGQRASGDSVRHCEDMVSKPTPNPRLNQGAAEGIAQSRPEQDDAVIRRGRLRRWQRSNYGRCCERPDNGNQPVLQMFEGSD